MTIVFEELQPLKYKLDDGSTMKVSFLKYTDEKKDFAICIDSSGKEIGVPLPVKKLNTIKKPSWSVSYGA